MFTVGDGSDTERPAFTYTSLSAGWEIVDFTFTGQPGPVSERFDFNDGIFNVRFETPGINMYFGVAGNLTGAEDRNLLNIGALIYNDFILTSSENFQLLLPLQLNTDLMRVQASSASNRFQQSSFQLGAGLGARTGILKQLNATFELVPNYGFSNSQGAFIGGTVFTLNGKARFYLENILANNAVVLGYDYRYKSYNIDADIFNYDYNSHSVTIGITF